MAQKDKKTRKRVRDVLIPAAPRILSLVISRFDDMEQFKHFMLSAIEKEKKSVEKRFTEFTKDMTDEEIQDADWFSDDYFMVENVFSKISLHSFIIVLYSYVERGLNSLCNAKYWDMARLDKKQGREPFKVRYWDMHGDGIRRAKLYLEKVLRVDLHAGEQPWAEIDALRRIRNAIVHEGGWANEELAKNQCVKASIKKGYVEIEQRRDGSLGKIIIKPGYLDWITKQAREFFRKVAI